MIPLSGKKQRLFLCCSISFAVIILLTSANVYAANTCPSGGAQVDPLPLTETHDGECDSGHAQSELSRICNIVVSDIQKICQAKCALVNRVDKDLNPVLEKCDMDGSSKPTHDANCTEKAKKTEEGEETNLKEYTVSCTASIACKCK